MLSDWVDPGEAGKSQWGPHTTSGVVYAHEVRGSACSSEDLLIMKAFANRPRDRADIKTVVGLRPGELDMTYTLDWSVRSLWLK